MLTVEQVKEKVTELGLKCEGPIKEGAPYVVEGNPDKMAEFVAFLDENDFINDTLMVSGKMPEKIGKVFIAYSGPEVGYLAMKADLTDDEAKSLAGSCLAAAVNLIGAEPEELIAIAEKEVGPLPEF